MQIAELDSRVTVLTGQIGRTQTCVLVESSLNTGGLGRLARVRGARVDYSGAALASEARRAEEGLEGRFAGAAVQARVGGATDVEGGFAETASEALGALAQGHAGCVVVADAADAGRGSAGTERDVAELAGVADVADAGVGVEGEGDTEAVLAAGVA